MDEYTLTAEYITRPSKTMPYPDDSNAFMLRNGQMVTLQKQWE